jgi:hypothetical protein
MNSEKELLRRRTGLCQLTNRNWRVAHSSFCLSGAVIHASLIPNGESLIPAFWPRISLNPL